MMLIGYQHHYTRVNPKENFFAQFCPVEIFSSSIGWLKNFRNVESGMWNFFIKWVLECDFWNVECDLSSVGFNFWNVEFDFWNVESDFWNVAFGILWYLLLNYNELFSFFKTGNQLLQVYGMKIC